MQKVRFGPGPARRVWHALDCGEAPRDAAVLDLEDALDYAENPATTLCSLCGCAQEITPLLRGLAHTGEELARTG
ncbi:hypothetical protein GTY54_39790 [Streptomyces sp. SID625]|nr:hypothetical protein [Streptomyces sp. SID625]